MERFLLQKSTNMADGYVVTDTVNNIVITFKEHQFNNTQNVTFLNDEVNADALQVARIMQEIGQWLYDNHRDISL
jgi:virulence-associated protein VapD